MTDDATRLRAVLEPIVRRAGALLLASRATMDTGAVERKSSSLDLVTEVDRQSQALLQAELERAFPGETIIAEEGSDAHARRDGRFWLVDPLDGTTNFVHGLPLYCVSVARLQDGVLECGMIYAPRLDELYWSARGDGAYRDLQRLSVSKQPLLDDALLCSGFPYDIRTHPDDNLREWSHLALRCRGLRRTGSAALDLAWVASGHYDGFWEYRLGPWDFAAGALMVREAGGCLTDPHGSEEFPWHGNVVATNGTLHAELLHELRQARRT